MVEEHQDDLQLCETLDRSILAPFITKYDPATGKATVSMPREIAKRLESPAFTENLFPERGQPTPGRLQLIKKTVLSEETEYSIDDQIKKIFSPSNREWVSRKEKLMKERGFTQDESNWGAEDTHHMPDARQHSDSRLFTVKMDNLPDGMSQGELIDELHRHDCYYFAKVVVPRDRDSDKFKPWAFIKFERLRWAVMFLEDYQKLEVQRVYQVEMKDKLGFPIKGEDGKPVIVQRVSTMITNSQLTT